jgi:hypothetical protein
MNDKQFYSTNEILELFNIHRQTLFQWRKKGLISYQIIGKRKFIYKKEEIEKLLGITNNQKKKNVIYCRVSNQKQKNDLIKQQQILSDYCNSNGIIVDTVYSEIASGMNENRSEFNKMITSVLNNEISNIFITYKDRFTRFGFDYFQNICKQFDCNIVVLNNKIDEENFEKELTDDIISVIHHFSMKLYSKRRKNLKELQKLIESKECENK